MLGHLNVNAFEAVARGVFFLGYGLFMALKKIIKIFMPYYVVNNYEIMTKKIILNSFSDRTSFFSS